MALDATAGSATANSFVTLVEAEAFMALLIFKTAWTGGDTVKEAALMYATKLMYTFPWIGVRSTSTQALAWPRKAGIVDNYEQEAAGQLVDEDGYYISSTTVPTPVKDACIMLAYELLKEDRMADAGALVPQSLSVSGMSITSLQHSPIPASVIELLRGYLCFDPRNGGKLVRS